MCNVASDLRGRWTPWHQAQYHVMVSLCPSVLINTRQRDHGHSSGHYYSSLSSLVCLFADVEERIITDCAIRGKKTQRMSELTNQNVGKLSVCSIPEPLSPQLITLQHCTPGSSLMWPSGPWSVINLYEMDGPEPRPKCLYMTETVFALLPLNGLCTELREEEMKGEKWRKTDAGDSWKTFL